jgi:hypothetical protein
VKTPAKFPEYRKPRRLSAEEISKTEENRRKKAEEAKEAKRQASEEKETQALIRKKLLYGSDAFLTEEELAALPFID